jgi:CRP/FNR family cyclic AMP-dependent transcriptional regulator
VLIEQGVPVEDLYILLEGRLAVWLKPRRGPEKEIARLNAGEILGEMSFVDARPDVGHSEGVEESDGLYLAGERFDRMVKRVMVS